MGFFSFKTQDTRRSIANNASSKPTFNVYMVDNQGNEFFEPSYSGYGVFGDKDYFVLMAEMNGLYDESDQRMRSLAIDLYYNPKPDTLFPNLYAKAGNKWRNKRPDNCPNQGFFY
jgi:hypothetical protein